MFIDLIGNFFKKIKLFINNIKDYVVSTKNKISNLEEVNINMAMNYLDENKLEDAYSRFKIIHKLWPNNIDGIYFYSLLLFFSNKKEEAIQILNKGRHDSNVKKLLDIVENKNVDYVFDVLENSNGVMLSGIRDVL